MPESDSQDDIKVKKIMKHKKLKKKRKTQYSEFYNFYFELCVRLKKRMKEDISNFKFRKATIQEEDVQLSQKNLKPIRGRSKGVHVCRVKSSATRVKKIMQKQEQSFSSSLSASNEDSDGEQRSHTIISKRDVVEQKRPRAEKAPKLRISRRVITSEESRRSMADQQTLKQSSQRKYESESDNQSASQQSIHSSKKSEKLSSNEQMQSQSSHSYDNQQEKNTIQEKDQSEPESEENEQDMEELQDAAMEEGEDEFEEDVEEEQEEQEESMEDLPFSEDEESEDDIQDSSIDSSEEEDSSEKHSENDLSEMSSQSIQNQSQEFSQQILHVRKRGRPRINPPKIPKNKRGPRKTLENLSVLKNALAGEQTAGQTVRKQSLVEKDLINEAKQRIQEEIRNLVEQLVESELELTNYGECRTQNINVYELVFKIVIDRNTDLLECIPGLFYQWNQAWGNLVTLKITTYARQYKKLMEIIYMASNLLQKSNLLSEFVGLSTINLQRQTSLPFLIMKIMVGKNLIKKLIGYQERVLFHIRKKYSVNFDFDQDLVNDVVYQIYETSPLYVFGRGRDVIKVCQLLQSQLDMLQVRTLHITKDESNFIFVNIKEVKSFIDPCEIRVKRTAKEKAEINHPFYQVPNLSREVCLIGSEAELNRAEQRIYEFYTMRRDAPDITKTSLCFLIPIMLHGEKRVIKADLLKAHPEIQFLSIDPVFPRKHISIFLQGPWKVLMQAKDTLEKFLNPSFNRIWQPSYKTYEEFEQFTLHQSLKFVFKQLKRSQIEKNCKIQTHWDVCSIELQQLGLHQQLRVQEEQEEYSLVTKLLGKDYLQRMRQILSKEVHTDPCSIFEHPDMKQRFESLRPEQQQQIICLRKRRKYLKHYRIERFKHILRYLRIHDQETCLNALFVLASSPQSLEDILEKLTLTKDQVIIFAYNLILDSLSQGKFPSINSYLKHRQIQDMKELAERQVFLKERRRLKAIETLSRIKSAEVEQEESSRSRRRSRSRDRDSTFMYCSLQEKLMNSNENQNNGRQLILDQNRSNEFQEKQKQAYEVINPTQSAEDDSKDQEKADQTSVTYFQNDLNKRKSSQKILPLAVELQSDYVLPNEKQRLSEQGLTETSRQEANLLLKKQQSLPIAKRITDNRNELIEEKPRTLEREDDIQLKQDAYQNQQYHENQLKKQTYLDQQEPILKRWKSNVQKQNSFQRKSDEYEKYETITDPYSNRPKSYQSHYQEREDYQHSRYPVKRSYNQLQAIEGLSDDSYSSDLIFDEVPASKQVNYVDAHQEFRIVGNEVKRKRSRSRSKSNQRIYYRASKPSAHENSKYEQKHEEKSTQRSDHFRYQLVKVDERKKHQIDHFDQKSDQAGQYHHRVPEKINYQQTDFEKERQLYFEYKQRRQEKREGTIAVNKPKHLNSFYQNVKPKSQNFQRYEESQIQNQRYESSVQKSFTQQKLVDSEEESQQGQDTRVYLQKKRSLRPSNFSDYPPPQHFSQESMSQNVQINKSSHNDFKHEEKYMKNYSKFSQKPKNEINQYTERVSQDFSRKDNKEKFEEDYEKMKRYKVHEHERKSSVERLRVHDVPQQYHHSFKPSCELSQIELKKENTKTKYDLTLRSQTGYEMYKQKHIEVHHEEKSHRHGKDHRTMRISDEYNLGHKNPPETNSRSRIEFLQIEKKYNFVPQQKHHISVRQDEHETQLKSRASTDSYQKQQSIRIPDQNKVQESRQLHSRSFQSSHKEQMTQKAYLRRRQPSEERRRSKHRTYEHEEKQDQRLSKESQIYSKEKSYKHKKPEYHSKIHENQIYQLK